MFELVTASTASYAPAPYEHRVEETLPMPWSDPPVVECTWATAADPSIRSTSRGSTVLDAASVQQLASAQNDSQLESVWAVSQDAVRRWEALQSGWDGEDAAAPSVAALAGSRAFLEQARVASVSPPSPYITSDAELGFRWAKDGGFASVSFADDGNIVAFCRLPGAADALRIDAPFIDLDLTALFDGNSSTRLNLSVHDVDDAPRSRAAMRRLARASAVNGVGCAPSSHARPSARVRAAEVVGIQSARGQTFI